MSSHKETPADNAEREAAIDPSRSCIVQAPAGSGKTELLSRRVLRLLTIVKEPEEIVALTFTRKAAREMRERITEALIRATGPAPDEPYRRTTWELARTALERDELLGWHLLEHPSRLRVTTIDSLCHSIARRMPMLSGFGAVPETTDSPDEIYATAARELLATLESDLPWSPALAHLLRHLDNDMIKVEALIVGMLSRRDQWLRHIGFLSTSGDGGLTAARAELERGLLRAREEAIDHLSRLAGPTLSADLAHFARHAARSLAAGGNAGSPLLACVDVDELPTTADGVEVWLGVAHLLLTDRGELRKPRGVTKNIGFGAEKEKKDVKLAFQALLEVLAGDQHARFLAALAEVHVLPPSAYTDEQWAVIEALIEVLKAAVGYLRTRFQIDNACDFAEVALAARIALDDGTGPTELALALDAEIRHLLVDEFQDTSHSQFELVKRLTREWTPIEGQTLFVVGDPMQSIYRFREAEVGLFMQAWEYGIGGIQLERLRLSVNFRSQPEVVDWINETFASIFPAENDIGSGAVGYSPSVAGRATSTLPSSVEFHPMIGVNRAAEAEKVISILANERVADPEASIAILVKDRNALEAIVPALRDSGVAFQAVEIDKLGTQQSIADLFALTRAIVNPADRIAWLALLRAPWCGLQLADMHAIIGDDRSTPIWDLIRDPSRRAACSSDGSLRVEKLIRVLTDVFRGYRRGTLRQTVTGCWLALGGPACVGGEAALRDARRYLELLEEHEEAGEIRNLEALEQAVAKLYASPDLSQDRVQIMTIHKAKGLEFDVVVLPALERKGRGDDPALLLYTERPQGGGNDLLIAPIKSSEESADPIYSFLQHLEKEKSAHEMRRLLYVATTRARRRLHVLGSVKDSAIEKGTPGGLLALLYDRVREDFVNAALRIHSDSEAASRDASEAAPPPREPRPMRRLVAGWELPAPPADVRWLTPFDGAGAEPRPHGFLRTWAEATTRHVGTVVHDLLCTITRQGLDSWDVRRVRGRVDVIRHALSILGVAAGELDRAVDRVVDAVCWTIGDDRGRWVLSPAHSEAAGELPITGFVDGALKSVRIDRTFIDDEGTRWIIDFKIPHHIGGAIDEFLAREQERYAWQLREYAELMRALDPERTIRCGLYFPGLGWRDWEEMG